MSVGRTGNQPAKERDANVLLEMQIQEPMSEDVLDANSDDVLEAVERHAADIALGPAIALNVQDCAIRLRFDVRARDNADVYKQIAKVIGVIEKHTDLALVHSRSDVETVGADSDTSEFAPA